MKNKILKIVFVLFGVFLTSRSVNAAILSFGSSSVNVGVGQQTTIDVVVNTQGQNVVGVDAIINFDSSHIQIVSVLQGTISQFTSYPLLTTANPIRISALAFGSGSYNGTGVLARITIRGLALGTSQMTYTFTQGSTTDSNVSQETTAVDLLSSVQAITVNVVTPATSTPITPRVNGTSTVLPHTALISDEIDMIIIGSVLMLAGLMLYRSGSYVLIGNTIWAYGGQAIWDNSKRKKNSIRNTIRKTIFFFELNIYFLKTIFSNISKLFYNWKDNIGLKENEKFEKGLLKKDKKDKC